MFMLVMAPCKSILHEGDLIALTRDGRFIGYGTVVTVIDNSVLLDIGKQACKAFNELDGESIPYDFEIM
jgi:hypothetical protein